MPKLISEIHVRVSKDEKETLEQMGAGQQAPLSSIVRAMVRHFILEWRAGRSVTAQLGAVTFIPGSWEIPNWPQEELRKEE